jgi:hypothetical protein
MYEKAEEGQLVRSFGKELELDRVNVRRNIMHTVGGKKEGKLNSLAMFNL